MGEMTCAAGMLEDVLHRAAWSSPAYVAGRLKMVVDELRRFPSLGELEELGRFKAAELTDRSGFADLAEAIRAHGFSLDKLYESFGGSSYLKAKEMDFPYPHQVAAVAMLGEKKRLLVHAAFRTGKTAIGVIAKPYLEANVLNRMTSEQEAEYAAISAMSWSEERQQREETFYHAFVREKVPTIVVAPSSVKATWRRGIDGYLGVSQTVVMVNSDSIVVEKTRSGERKILRNSRLEDLKAALAENPDYLIISYDMVFRTTAAANDSAVKDAVAQRQEAYAALLSTCGEAEQQLRAVLGNGWATAALEKQLPLDVLVSKIATEEVKQESAKIFEVLRDYGFRLLVLDEVDNARNANALRTRAVKELAAGTEYFLAMSGYPAPNRVIRDLGQLAAMIDAEHYDQERFPGTAVPFGTVYANHPELVRDFVLLHSQPRTELSDLGVELSEVKRKDVLIDLEGLHSQVYEKIRRFREIDSSRKLLLLRAALLDPTLMHPAYYPGRKSMREKLAEIFAESPGLLAQIEAARQQQEQGAASISDTSSSYRALDRIVANAVRKGEKVVVYTTLKAGVTNRLKEHYGRMGLGVYRIDGDIATEKDEELGDREKMRLDFQTNPARQLIIINDTMKAGINLDAANHEVKLDLPFDPGTYEQVSARVVGTHQGRPVTLYDILPRNTVARGIQSMLREKDMDIRLVFQGHEMTPEQMRRLEERGGLQNPHLVSSINPQDVLAGYFRRMRARGYHANLDFILANDALAAQRYAESYEYDWEHSYSAQTNRLIVKKVIEPLARNGQLSLDSILDNPGGNYALARILIGETRLQFGSMTMVDFNHYQLEYGERALKQLLNGKVRHRSMETESILGAMHDLSFAKDGQFTLAVSSLGIHYSPHVATIDELVDGELRMKRFREREQIVREIVRATRKDGHIIFTFPTSAVDYEGVSLFTSSMKRLGVDVVQELNGIAAATKPEGSLFETYLWVGRKGTFSSGTALPEDAFVLNTSVRYTSPYSRRVSDNGRSTDFVEGETCTDFAFRGREVPVGEMAAKYLRRIGAFHAPADMDVLRRKLHQHTSELGYVRGRLKTEFLETLEVMEAFPERLQGQRNRIRALADEVNQAVGDRSVSFSSTTIALLNDLLDELRRL